MFTQTSQSQQHPDLKSLPPLPTRVEKWANGTFLGCVSIFTLESDSVPRIKHHQHRTWSPLRCHLAPRYLPCSITPQHYYGDTITTRYLATRCSFHPDHGTDIWGFFRGDIGAHRVYRTLVGRYGRRIQPRAIHHGCSSNFSSLFSHYRSTTYISNTTSHYGNFINTCI